jgi:hypothetical protein
VGKVMEALAINERKERWIVAIMFILHHTLSYKYRSENSSPRLI